MFLKIFKFKIYTGVLSRINLSSKTIINTINPHSYIISRKDKLFFNSLSNSDYLFPDGIGIVIAAKVLYNKKIERITGAKIHDYLLKKAVSESLKVFYLGSSDETLKLIKLKNTFRHSNLKVHYFSPPFRSNFSKNETDIMLKKINLIKPDVLFIGMTAPKQEKWVHLNKNLLDARIICSIGAVFDFYAGNIKRAPKILIFLGLEWAHRFVKQPKRLFKRNFVSSPLFVFYLLFEKVKFVFFK